VQEIPEHRRSDAVSSMVYEANARVRDPVYGCVALIHTLRQEIASLQTQLAVVQAQMVYLMMQQDSNLTIPSPTPAPTDIPLSPSPAFDEVVEEFTTEDTLTIST
jgi:outer membrane protein TolC